MRAVICEALGDATLPLGSGVLRLVEDLPTPPLKPGHVRIKVLAASVNFPDTLQIKVCAVSTGGAYAEELVTPEIIAWPIPDGVDVAVAAALPVAYGTADVALRHRAQLKKGQTVLVLGAAGGVGVAAVQIAKLLGARTIAVVAGQDKVAFMKDVVGADVVLDYSQASKEEPLSKLIKQAAPKGVHVVFDPVGGKLFSEALKSVAWGAHYLVIGFASGDIPRVAANLLLVKNTTLHGLFWGSYLDHRPSVLLDSMQTLLQWLARGDLTIHVSHQYPLEQLPEAFKQIVSRKVMGKVLITMQQASSKL